MWYVKSYHQAVNHLIRQGACEHDIKGRKLIAKALKDLRKLQGRQNARKEYYHMLQICGGFPTK